MAQRTFGWVQNPASIETLRDVVSIFVKDSYGYLDLINKRIPTLIEYDLVDDENIMNKFLKYFTELSKIEIPYDDLKGKGAGSVGRANAKCSGIIQAVITAQKNITVYNRAGEKREIKKPYTDDWTADGYLRWAISVGLLDYDEDTDKCMISKRGEAFVNATTEKEQNDIIGEAFLSYPPVVRVLNLLKEKGHLTKFEIGKELGFVGEAGFTSIPQNIWIASYCDTSDPKEKNKLRSDVEGSSDKYARMICSWLAKIGWVKKQSKRIELKYAGTDYTCDINSAFVITLEGLKNLKKAYGSSSYKRIPKIVFYEMLATKTPDKEYIRSRRAHIIKYTSGTNARKLTDIQAYLKTKGFDEGITCIEDDIKGLERIGLNYIENRGTYILKDDVEKLSIPAKVVEKTDVTVIKDRIREKLHNVNHKYLTLIDLSFDGSSDRDFEIETIDLLTNELDYIGKRLGDTRKPDGIISYNTNGLIIDNKAYGEGYALPRSQADEMVRYLQENNERKITRNPNKWWEEFDSNVVGFHYVFISSLFKGKFKERLEEIYASTGVKGGVLNSENLLYMAEQLKSGDLDYDKSFELFDCCDEIKIAL